MPLVASEPAGAVSDGRPIERFVLRSARLELHVLTLGGIIQRLLAPDRDGVMGDVILGFDTAADYLRDTAYHGAVIGRCANRIADARFPLDGTTIELPANDGPHHLHGGPEGFHRQLWRAQPLAAGVRLEHTSPEGAGGYPGVLDASVTYSLADDRLTIELEAVTTRPTPVNLTQHAYFNLAGDPARGIGGHALQVRAERYVAVTASLIPTGELCPVAGTPFDLRSARTLDAVFAALPAGLDHTYALAAGHAATLLDPASGRCLDVHTTEPGIQVYTGNFLDGSARGRGGVPLAHRGGLCLETQHFPDAVNQPHFAPVVLRPGERYHTRTTWTFGTVAANQD